MVLRSLVAMLLLVAAPLVAQQTLTRVEALAETGPATFDSVRQRPSMLVDGTFWSFDGSRWQRVWPAGSTAPAIDELVFDTGRGVHVAWNGDAIVEYAGTAPLVPPQPGAPSQRFEVAMTYDAARGETVLFGGMAIVRTIGNHYYVAPLTGTFAWRQGQWRSLSSSHPSARFGHAMAYDPARAVVVMFGGTIDYGVTPPNGDTWEWDGQRWQPRSPASSPPPRSGHAMAHDPMSGRVVLHGGRNGSALLTDTWSWDGTNWSPGPAGPGRVGHSLVEDPGGVLLVGGTNGNSFPLDTWRLVAGQWTEVTTARGVDSSDCNLLYDPLRDELVHFGVPPTRGAPLETWTWAGAWSLRPSSGGPADRIHAAASFDGSRVVLFGGHQPVWPTLALGDTWLWDGANWQQHTSTPSPQPRSKAAIAHDPLRQRVLLFGGLAANLTALADAWTWDGTAWVPVPGGPPAGDSYGLVFDVQRSALVLAGPNETWEWAGTWQQRSTAGVPGLLRQTIASDPASGVATVLEGLPYSLAGVRRWRWDGASWTSSPFVVPPNSFALGAATHSTRGRLFVMNSDMSFHPVRAGLHVLGSTPAGAVEVAPAGCIAGPALDLTLLGSPTPGVDVALAVRGPAANAPTFVMLGLASAAVPVGNGCLLGTALRVGTIAATANAAGGTSSAVPIPDLPALRGLQVFAQAAAIVPGGPAQGFALSGVLAIRVGD